MEQLCRSIPLSTDSRWIDQQEFDLAAKAPTSESLKKWRDPVGIIVKALMIFDVLCYNEQLQRQLVCILCILLLYGLAKETEALCPDGQALVNFRTAIVNSDGILLQWRPEDETPCGWKGIKCDVKTKRVTALSLANHRLIGPMSPDLGKLEYLQFLALNGNNFYGAIPPELGNCSQLQSLFLQGNYLSGWIPSELGNLSQLENLDLSSNSLSGNIPASLGNLKKLTMLNVSTNFLVGPIPPGGVLDGFKNVSFVDNRELCGKQIQACKNNVNGTSALSEATDSGKAQGKTTYSDKLLLWALATVLVALLCICGCYLYKMAL